MWTISRYPAVVIMPVTAPSCSSTALVPIVVPCSTWSMAGRGKSKRAHSSPIPATTPRDGSSLVVGVLWIRVRPDSVSANTMSVNVPPTSRPIRYILSSHCLARVRTEFFTASADSDNPQQTGANDEKRQPGRHRTQGVNDWGGGIGLHGFEFERQRVQCTDGLRGSRDLVVGEGETEQRNSDQARSDDRHDDVPYCLPAPRAQIARRLLIGRVEAVEYRQHDEEAKGQGPGEVGAEGGTPPGPLDPEYFEHRSDAEADHHRRHHQAGDRDIKQQGGPEEAATKGKTRKKRKQHGRGHHDRAQSDRSIERPPNVADRLGAKQLAEPMQRNPVHWEDEPAFLALESEHHDSRYRAVEKHDKKPNENRERVKDRWSSGAPHLSKLPADVDDADKKGDH